MSEQDGQQALVPHHEDLFGQQIDHVYEDDSIVIRPSCSGERAHSTDEIFVITADAVSRDLSRSLPRGGEVLLRRDPGCTGSVVNGEPLVGIAYARDGPKIAVG